LIVTCEQCATQFQLDDSRVPPGGVRVRCSRCKHAFFIEPAAGAQPESPFERAAQQALDAEASPTPEATEDLAESAGADGADFEDASDASDESTTDESDWEFNEAPVADESPAAGEHVAAQDAAREAVDDLLGSGPASRVPATPPARTSRREPASFAAGSSAAEDDLGSPESWDLLSEDSPSISASSAAAVSSDAETAGSQAPPEPVRAHSVSVSRPTAEEWIAPSEPSRLAAWIARSGHAAGWSVTAALSALVAVATLGPGLSAESESGLGTQHLAQLEAQGIAGRWVENVAAGPLFVVSGHLVNLKAEPMPLGALAGVRLLDANGARLAGEPAAIGPVIEPRDLREADPAALRARQLQGGSSLAAEPLQPGQSVPFEAVVVMVPAAAARFVLEPISSGRIPSNRIASGSSASVRGEPLAAANEPAPAR